MHPDTWATLPCDLFVEILRRLRSTAVFRCAGVCRPWRRAIIDNAWCLRLHPDCFLPHLLLTFVDKTWRSEDVLALKGGLGVDVGLYNTPLSSRDGFLLLAGDMAGNSLCLCNPLAGTCRFLPAAAFGVSKNNCTYVLVTDDDHNDSAVRILAVEGKNIEDGMPYQVFSPTSSAWGPVRRSAKLDSDFAQVSMFPDPNHVVVCRGSVYSIVLFISMDRGAACMCIFAMDMGSGEAWTTELPETCGWAHCDPCELVMATSGDGRQLSVLALKEDRRIVEVWVLVGDSWWTLQRKMDLQSLLLHNCPSLTYFWLSGFCPRSGCLFGVVRVDQDLRRHFVVGVDGGSPRLMETVLHDGGYRFPYEMDWSTYMSKIKYF